MLLTNSDLAQRRKYEEAQSKQFGNLHERMKLVMAICRQRGLQEDKELWDALFDLELEVSMHAPADPPFGRRKLPNNVSF